MSPLSGNLAGMGRQTNNQVIKTALLIVLRKAWFCWQPPCHPAERLLQKETEAQ